LKLQAGFSKQAAIIRQCVVQATRPPTAQVQLNFSRLLRHVAMKLFIASTKLHIDTIW